jgi:hypothetical protein
VAGTFLPPQGPASRGGFAIAPTPTVLRLLAICSLVVAALPAGRGESPSPEDHWMAYVGHTHPRPTDMLVVVAPPAYADLTGPAPAPASDAALAAVLEALDYWAWFLQQGAATDPHLRYLSFHVEVLGRDATQADLARADVVVSLGGATAPVAGDVWAGSGNPIPPPGAPAAYQDGRCVLQADGVAGSVGAQRLDLLRNSMLHEFGHCLGAGHTGESGGSPHCDGSEALGVGGTCYDSHPTDVMSVVLDDRRQCLSNLNLQTLSVGYAWLDGPDAAWQPAPVATYMLKSDYATTCMPDALARY